MSSGPAMGHKMPHTPNGTQRTDKNKSRELEVVEYFRKRKRMSVEQDIVSLAGGFLEETLRSRLTDSERLALESWLSGQLEAERKGWKQKLHMSLNEVERERKLALDAHAAIQDLNGRVENVIDEYCIHFQDNEYIPSDYDLKQKHVKLLERNIDAIVNNFVVLYQERQECLKFLQSIPESDASLLAVLMRTIEKLKNDSHLNNIAKDNTESALQEEIDLLKKELKIQEERIQENEKVHLKTIHTMSKRFSEERYINKLNKTSASDKATQMEISQNNEGDITIKVDETRINADIDYRTIGTSTPIHKTIDFSCQVSLKGEPRDSLPLLNKLSSNSQTSLEHGGSDSSSEQSYPFKEPEDSYRQKRKSIAMSTIRNQYLTLQKTKSKKTDKENNENRKQKLSKAQSEGNIHNKVNKAGEDRYHDGYLSGVRKEILTGNTVRSSDLIYMKQGNHLRKSYPGQSSARSQTDNSPRTSPKSNSRRCLRCHKLYNLRDNHKMACRYHPKGKRKLESYDSKGKLSMVTYIWECCMQKPETVGCSTGEHI